MLKSMPFTTSASFLIMGSESKYLMASTNISSINLLDLFINLFGKQSLNSNFQKIKLLSLGFHMELFGFVYIKET